MSTKCLRKVFMMSFVSVMIISCGSSEPTAVGSWGVLDQNGNNAVEKLRIDESGDAKFLEYECRWKNGKQHLLNFDCLVGSDHAAFEVELISDSNLRLDSEIYHRLN